MVPVLLESHAVPGARNFEIRPFALGSLTRDGADARPSRQRTVGHVGLDAKYGITQNLMADFTYNTDFAHVEADQRPGSELFVVYTEDRDTAGAHVAEPWNRGLAVKMNWLLRY